MKAMELWKYTAAIGLMLKKIYLVVCTGWILRLRITIANGFNTWIHRNANTAAAAYLKHMPVQFC